MHNGCTLERVPSIRNRKFPDIEIDSTPSRVQSLYATNLGSLTPGYSDETLPGSEPMPDDNARKWAGSHGCMPEFLVVASTHHSLYVHIIFATHDRAPMIEMDWREDMHRYLGGAIKGLGAKSMIVGGVADHVHILASLKTTQAVADLVREIKKSSSLWAVARHKGFAWQTGYAAFSVSVDNVPAVQTYIANQETHHLKLSSSDELRRLLSAHGLEINEQFFE